MTNKDLANLLFPNINKTIEDYETIYPKRNLDTDAIVTRYAPSPTGFIHIGALLAAFVGGAFSRQTNGVFYLRIEDTDTKRTIDNGISLIINGLKEFGVTFDEGPIDDNNSIGNYGPYIQSERKEIYQTYAKHLVELGLAYPCFCSEEEIENIRNTQAHRKSRIGYYGKWAKCRSLSIEEACERIKKGEKPVIRLRSNGDYDNKIICHDEIRGDVTFPENDLDIVIIKSDGLPTYHFAHAIDDHLMRSTHIIRGDEWLSSLPIHLQLFDMLGFERPKYAHISPLSKIDEETGNMRKLSKRKDPEAAMSYYHELGIPYEAVVIYLATIASSDFEEWMMQNPDKTVNDFKFDFSRMSKSGALFDLDKLNNICKNYISRLTAKELYDKVKTYLLEYNEDFYKIFTEDEEYSCSVLNIERNSKKPRKDIGKYSDVYENVYYMYDSLFEPKYENLSLNADMYIDYIENGFNVETENWFNDISEFARKYNYVSMKEYKNDPLEYTGNISEFCEGLRYIVTGKTQTPSLQEILTILGKERVLNRLNNYKDISKRS